MPFGFGKRAWRRALGLSNAQRQLSRSLGFPLSGRRSRNVGKPGCVVFLATGLILIAMGGCGNESQKRESDSIAKRTQQTKKLATVRFHGETADEWGPRLFDRHGGTSNEALWALQQIGDEGISWIVKGYAEGAPGGDLEFHCGGTICWKGYEGKLGPYFEELKPKLLSELARANEKGHRTPVSRAIDIAGNCGPAAHELLPNIEPLVNNAEGMIVDSARNAIAKINR